MRLYRFLLSMFFVGLFLGASLASAIDSEYWGYCQDERAFRDANYQFPKPEADWVCRAPTADQSGEAIERNTLRCLLDQKENCQVGAGGDLGARGTHNVPLTAWYWIPGAKLEFPDVRCECGCFARGTRIFSSRGYQLIEDLAKQASREGGLSLAVMAARGEGFKESRKLFKRNFVVGPEKNALVSLLTEKSRSLTLTQEHPVLIERGGAQNMVRAVDLKIGDHLLGADGQPDELTELAFVPPPPGEEEQLVYNVDTRGEHPFEHAIYANGIVVGDLYWQKRLSERQNRIRNLLNNAPGT